MLSLAGLWWPNKQTRKQAFLNKVTKTKSRTRHQDKYQSDILNNQEINKINAEYIQCMHTEFLCVLNVCLYSFMVFS